MGRSNVLLVNDWPGYSRVALSAMTPIMYYMGYSVLSLPTMVISNTLDYGKFSILDSTDYIQEALKVWESLGFDISAMGIGFVTNNKQIELCENILHKNYTNKPYVMVDPIMGDNGELYNGIEVDRIEIMRELMSFADLSIPNITESYLLLEERFNCIDVNSKGELKDLIDGIRSLGSKSVIITSVCDPNGNFYIAGYDRTLDEYFKLPYDRIPVNYPGTGDIFSAIVLSFVLKGYSLKDSSKFAGDFIRYAITESEKRECIDRTEGLNIERHLHVLKND
ncbi:bifunctional hydroxymethylpyrimidine kinase/phosphomethylpyrimidine kinase [Lagierella sp.]|uniref:bifunctional hydroxymethylpyrimidine kinase/phosphomethylpyrimidine kinase n=1 Tax=Lagierella sp. TaxID=2849657 RepID=UPI0026159313|nr:bifunctional hydroxymethylpyrimidine kinase/phosphomethylpyrimidine kinase [Lagierella sp.]